MSPKQMTLNLNLREDALLDNFYVMPKNSQLLKTLFQMAQGRGEHFLYLWGTAGSGCTHLLQACCHIAHQKKLSPFYLSLKEYDKLTPAVLEGLEDLYFVAIDDIDAIAGNAKWEEALFDFFNRMQSSKKRLIMAAHAPPNRLNLQLIDLVSRLLSSLVFQVVALTDPQKIEALKARAKVRGFLLSDTVAKFILGRYPRDMTSLFSVLDKLDRASLEAQHKLTIPFVKTVLEE